MSKEMNIEEAIEISNNFKNEDCNCKYTLVEVKQAIGIILVEIEELQKKSKQIKQFCHKENLSLVEYNMILEKECFRLKNNSISKDKIKELDVIDISGFECVALEDIENLLKENEVE